MEDKYSINIQKTEITLKDLVLTIQEYYNYLLGKWIIILVFGVLGGLIGYYYAFKKDVIFNAATTFVLEENGGGAGGAQYAGLASMVGLDLGGGGGGLFQGDNIMELYKSRSMLQSTLLSSVKYKGSDRLLVDLYIDMNDLRSQWKDDTQLKNIKFTSNGGGFSRLQDSVLGAIAKDVKSSNLFISKPDKKLSIIEVSVKAKDELFAKLFNEQIVKNVNDFYIKTKTQKSSNNLMILQHQTDSVRNVLNGAIYAGVITTDATPNLNPTRQILRAPIQRSQVNVEANKAMLSQLLQNLELSRIALRKETPLIQVIDEPILPLEKVRLGKIKALIIGGFIAGFLAVIVLLLKKVLNNILS
jgi:hypothetical protein